MIFISLRFGQTILIGATLSFLGLGARPPATKLGMMISQGREFLLFAPHIAVTPSILIVIIVLSANVESDALRDVLAPRDKVICQRQSKIGPKGSAKCCHFGVGIISLQMSASIRAAALVI